MPFEESDRRQAHQARSERIGEAIVVLALAGFLAACANWWL
jgi:hypothetical protein